MGILKKIRNSPNGSTVDIEDLVRLASLRIYCEERLELAIADIESKGVQYYLDKQFRFSYEAQLILDVTVETLRKEGVDIKILNGAAGSAKAQKTLLSTVGALREDGVDIKILNGAARSQGCPLERTFRHLHNHKRSVKIDVQLSL